MPKKYLFTLACTLLLSSCATVFNWPSETVKVKSNVPNTNIVITNYSNKVVYTGSVPNKIKLRKKRGFFRKERYTLRATSPGYQDVETILNLHLSPWYFGNILLGGAIGMVLVDPLTGAMWSFDENDISLYMQPQLSRN